MNFKTNKGVTPATVVITLMLMLIILQVTISTAINKDLAILKSMEAEEKQINSFEIEKILAVATEAATKSKGVLEKEILDEAMNGRFEEKWEYCEDPIQDKYYFLIKILETGNLYKIFKDGSVKIASESDIKKTDNTNPIGPTLITDYSTLKIGDKIKYDSTGRKFLEEMDNWETWEVFSVSEDGKNIEIISCNTMFDESGNGVTIGPSGVNAEDIDTNIDGEAYIGDEGDRTVLSYNNLVETINQFCKDIIKSDDYDDVYSIGLKEDIAGYYDEGAMNNWFKGDVTTLKKGDNYYDDLMIRSKCY